MLETLYRMTHSDKSYQIFTPKVYERIKKEEKFAVFVKGV